MHWTFDQAREQLKAVIHAAAAGETQYVSDAGDDVVIVSAEQYEVLRNEHFDRLLFEPDGTFDGFPDESELWPGVPRRADEVDGQ